MPIPRPPRRALPGARQALIVAAALIAIAVVPATPARAAVTATQAESMILDWVNDARQDRGLVRLARSWELAVIGGRRASRMVDTNTLSHVVSGSLSGQLANEGVAWYRYGESIGYTTAGWTADAAWSLFRMWRGSAPHWTLLMSDRFNYVGAGLAHRSSNNRTFGSIVLSESPDRSGARSWMTSVRRSGDDLRWTWSGRDGRLQTHTAGFRDFDVQYRAGVESWRTIRYDTTVTSVTLPDRGHGRTYSLRVRATDRRGNVGAWTSPSKIWVP